MASDPYAVLNLPRNFTLEQLRYNYKVLARQLHPDKCGARITREQANQTFQILTEAYRALLGEHKAREADKQFHELRATYRDHREREPRRENTAVPAAAGKRFNLARFNSAFQEYRVGDPVQDQGYADWMARNDPDAAGRPGTDQRQIVRYVQPEPTAIVRKGCTPFSELGADGVDDYSRSDVARHGIQYTDYRVAHTTTKLVDEAACAGRHDFRSIDDLQKHRSSISYVMSDEDARAEAEAQRAAEDREGARLQALRAWETRVEDRYRQAHVSLLGYAPSA